MFKWMRPRLELRGEIDFPPQPPIEVHIALVPPPEPEPEPEQIEYGPLRLVVDEDA